MICHQCLFRSSIRAVAKQVAPASAARTSSLLRPFSSSTIRTAQPISSGVAASSTPQRSPPAATSTSAAQPFSTPLTPSASALGVSSTGAKKSTALTSGVVSSVPAGTPLKGLNYLKNQTDPVAMEDHEYPAWLWEVLSEKKVGAGDEKEEIDPRLFSKSAKARRMAAKRQRKNAEMHPELSERKIPIYEQSIDLPAGDGTPEGAVEALGAREQLTQAMRSKRRRDIKEANFLKSMS